jgi:hypothetical protein
VLAVSFEPAASPQVVPRSQREAQSSRREGPSLSAVDRAKQPSLIEMAALILIETSAEDTELRGHMVAWCGAPRAAHLASMPTNAAINKVSNFAQTQIKRSDKIACRHRFTPS